MGDTGRYMCEGEFESLKAIYAVSPGFVPKPFAWGRYRCENPETYYLLTEFRDVGEQVCRAKRFHVMISWEFRAIFHWRRFRSAWRPMVIRTVSPCNDSSEGVVFNPSFCIRIADRPRIHYSQPSQ